MQKSPSNGMKDDQNNTAQWDEEDFVAGLARLERMQSEVCIIRNREELYCD
jgi:hypothetical protein